MWDDKSWKNTLCCNSQRNFLWSAGSSAAAWGRCFAQPSPASLRSSPPCLLVARTPTLPFVRPRGTAAADNGSILQDRKTTHTLKWQLSVQHPLRQLNECQPCFSYNFCFILNCTLATHISLKHNILLPPVSDSLSNTKQLMPHIDLPGSCLYLTTEASQAVESCREQTHNVVHCENANLPGTPVFHVHPLLKSLLYSKLW